ncbi:suppressor of Under-Replication [Arctopsyche grandis]|uniref:suppressor of Under-Replication n=1 Tax=Arctopsyche grandis TaxID=121162 RepID=UPI00406D6A05
MKSKPLRLSPPCLNSSGIHIQISDSYTHSLKAFQIEGIRFLYNQYLLSDGAILNDDEGLGKTVQTVLFASAIVSANASNCLIICEDIRFDHWLFHLQNWSNFTAAIYNGDVVRTGFYLSSLSDSTVVQHQDWGIVVVDDLNANGAVKFLRKIKCKFKLWLAKENLIDSAKELYKILSWISPSNVLPLKAFDNNFVQDGLDIMETWKRRQQLNIYSQQWLLRRTRSTVSDDLPLIPIKIYKRMFHAWKGCENFKENESFDNSTEGALNDSQKTDTSSLILVEDNRMEIFEVNDSESDQCSPSILSPPKPKNLYDMDNAKRRGTKDITGLKVKRSKKVLNDIYSDPVETNTNNNVDRGKVEAMDAEISHSGTIENNKSHFLEILFTDTRVKNNNTSDTFETPVKEPEEIQNNTETKTFKMLDNLLFASKSITR